MQPATNDEEMQRFASSGDRSHVTVRALDCKW